MSKILLHRKALCNQVRRVALGAGEITLKYFDDAGFGDASAKEDGSPVTIADQEAESFIEKALAEIAPDVPMVGEEATEAGRVPDLSGSEYSWRVDALDGTREFIRGGSDFTVNIALIYKGDPVLGVVYAPEKGELYAGYINEDGTGEAIKWLEDTDHEKSIHVRKAPKEGLTIVASKSHGDAEKLERFLADYKVEKLLKCGSSLKICAVAAGRADIYPRFGPTCEWDTAAADAVLRAAGGVITDTEGKALRYIAADPKFLNPEFIAWSVKDPALEPL